METRVYLFTINKARDWSESVDSSGNSNLALVKLAVEVGGRSPIVLLTFASTLLVSLINVIACLLSITQHEVALLSTHPRDMHATLGL